jgi:protein dithiol:quinone oxidoreductase
MTSGPMSLKLRRSGLRGHPSDRRHLLALALVALGAIGVALVSQHHFDMQPCPWCIVQRLLYACIGTVCLVAAAWPLDSSRRVQSVAALASIWASTAGAASALWQQLFAAKSSSCVRSMADVIVGLTQMDRLLPDLFQSRASCAEASVSLLGVPYAVWSLTLFLALSVAAFRLHLVQRHRVVIDDSDFGQHDSP